MGIAGRYVPTFKEANFASAVDVHMNGDYEFFYDVVSVEKGVVTLKGHKEQKEFKSQVRQGKRSQFITVIHKGVLQTIGFKAETVRVEPFLGERI